MIAALVTNGFCYELLRRTLPVHILATSVPLLDELESTLQRKFNVGKSVPAFLRSFRTSVTLVEPAALKKPVCRDATDDIVLATAIAAGADFIVTGDQDLLVLKSHEGVRILTPRAFLEKLDQG